MGPMVHHVCRTLGWIAMTAGCGAEHDTLIGEVTAPLAQEEPGIVEVVSRYYDDPEIARVSYASAVIPGCTAAMIGPTTFMTAASPRAFR